VANLFPQREFRISLILQPEPSDSEGGESRVRNRVGESFAINLRHGTDGCSSLPKEVRAHENPPSSAGPEPATESPMGRVASANH
jgi:hypothetical protein